MLLIGIWINLTKNPMNPITMNPIPTARAIWENSKNKYYLNHGDSRSKKCYWCCVPFWSGFLQRFKRLMLSLANWRGESSISLRFSIFVQCYGERIFRVGVAKTLRLFYYFSNSNNFECLIQHSIILELIELIFVLYRNSIALHPIQKNDKTFEYCVDWPWFSRKRISFSNFKISFLKAAIQHCGRHELKQNENGCWWIRQLGH